MKWGKKESKERKQERNQERKKKTREYRKMNGNIKKRGWERKKGKDQGKEIIKIPKEKEIKKF